MLFVSPTATSNSWTIPSATIEAFTFAGELSFTICLLSMKTSKPLISSSATIFSKALFTKAVHLPTVLEAIKPVSGSFFTRPFTSGNKVVLIIRADLFQVRLFSIKAKSESRSIQVKESTKRIPNNPHRQPRQYTLWQLAN